MKTFKVINCFLIPNDNTSSTIYTIRHNPNYFLNPKMMVIVKSKTHHEDVDDELRTFNHLHATSRPSELIMKST